MAWGKPYDRGLLCEDISFLVTFGLFVTRPQISVILYQLSFGLFAVPGKFVLPEYRFLYLGCLFGANFGHKILQDSFHFEKRTTNDFKEKSERLQEPKNPAHASS